MNLLQVLHQRWSADAALSNLLPASRVFTGLSPDRSLPYAVFSKASQRPLSLLGDGSAVDRVGVRIRLFHDRYDDGAEIAQQVKAAFDRIAFDLADDKKVLNMQRTDESEEQHDDGAWEFTVHFDCTVSLPAGV
ncbi:MAG: DUF3168 domain-containing protein [Pirellulales bacterium]|nr:DUF3168 domain-containing protein [Pirellulales bacterium]